MPATVFPFLQGGLGNQMFQIAAAVGLAERLGCYYACPRDLEGGRCQGQSSAVYSSSVYRKLKFLPIGAHLSIDEQRFAYTPISIPQGHEGDILLKGYRQSIKYWEHCRELVQQIFDFSWWNSDRLESLRREHGRPLCALHYRGGDYRQYAGIHYVCNHAYYRPIVEAMRDSHTIVLFTDDIEAAQSEGIYYDFHYREDFDGAELAAMSQCDAIIMANSTFSWWAAILGRDKKVHVPDAWFGPDGPADFQDIYEEEWIQHESGRDYLNFHPAWIRDNGERLRYEYDLNPSSVVVDIGGYLGAFANDISSKYHCTVKLFEPVPAFLEEARNRNRHNPQVEFFGLGLTGAFSGQRGIGVNDDATSFHLNGAETQTVRCEPICKALFDLLGLTRIDLLKINVEGDEFDLLNSLIDGNVIERIENIQVQFHRFISAAELLRRQIHCRLRSTHRLTFCYPFVWENWCRHARVE